MRKDRDQPPPSPARTIAGMLEFAALLRNLPPGFDQDVGIVLANGINKYLFDGVPLDVALGLKPRAGQRDPRERLSIARRDALLRQTAATFFSDLNQTGKAEALHRALLRYSTAGWRRDRVAPTCPPHRTGLDQALWNILKARAAVPAERTIHNALSCSELGVFVAQNTSDLLATLKTGN
jgi:hypothetical protein